MKVLITGGNGQLGNSIKKLADDYPGIDITYTDVGDLDITSKTDLDEYFKNNPVNYLVNCAAYTSVDKAEEDPETARLINTTAVENLVDFSEKYGFVLIQISTDYVFKGHHYRPYTEEDKPAPEGIYARTKAEAEDIVMKKSGKGIVLRTSWLYSEYGNNFLKTILNLADNREELTIICDQIGTPTYAGDLAKVVLEIIQKGYDKKNLFNFSNEGVASWYDFAMEIIDLSGKKCKITPIVSEEYPLPAPRPFYSLMSKKKFTDIFEYRIPHWKDSLSLCIRNMGKHK